MISGRIVKIVVLLLLTVTSAFAAERVKTFTFTKVDLEVVDQADLLDQKLDREGMVYHDTALNSYVTQVGLSMLPSGTSPERVRWTFHILRDPMPNAFSLPNGSVYINTGLLSLIENEDQLAGVLAHEITHVADRHTYLKNRDYRKKSAIISIVQFAGRMAPGGSNWGDSIQLVAIVMPIMMTASIYGYSRELEKDADIYSFNKLIEGNYEPREMLNVFRLLERKDEVEVPKVYYNDHPALETRIGYMNHLIEEKAVKPTSSDILASRKIKYQTLTEAVVREDIHLDIMSHKGRTALARASKLIDFHPNSADNLFCLGESYQALGPWAPHPTDKELSGGGKKQIHSMSMKFTADEEEQALLSRLPGETAWQDNSRLAEENYLKAIAADPNYAKTYRGLGELYYEEKRSKEALAAYEKYLELSPGAQDQNQVKLRVASLHRVIGQ
jgi:Zn-dependent protease with chaperone function